LGPPPAQGTKTTGLRGTPIRGMISPRNTIARVFGHPHFLKMAFTCFFTVLRESGWSGRTRAPMLPTEAPASSASNTWRCLGDNRPRNPLSLNSHDDVS